MGVEGVGGGRGGRAWGESVGGGRGGRACESSCLECAEDARRGGGHADEEGQQAPWQDLQRALPQGGPGERRLLPERAAERRVGDAAEEQEGDESDRPQGGEQQPVQIRA